MDSPNDSPNSVLARYWLGMIMSLALAGLIAVLGALMINSYGYGAYALLAYAIFPGLPLLLSTASIWLYYMIRSRGRVPAQVHGTMLLPVLAALMVVPVSQRIKQAKAIRFESAHPMIEEVHVNLSGRSLLLTTVGTNAPKKLVEPGRSVSLTLYPTAEDVKTGHFPYDGTRLRTDVDTYTSAIDDKDIGSYSRMSTQPLMRGPYPDLHTLTRFESEESLVVNQYFHYSDHVEVAPTLSPPSDYLKGRIKVDRPVLFSIAIPNHPTSAVVRMEINGQTLKIPDYTVYDQNWRCTMGSFESGMAFVDADQPLHVRWQTLDDPLRWHDATTQAPKFTRKLPPDSAGDWIRVVLYFLDSGKVAAERVQEVNLRDNKLALRVTGLPREVTANSTCGSAKDQYDLNNVELLPN
jgi:hypothetical protein